MEKRTPRPRVTVHYELTAANSEEPVRSSVGGHHECLQKLRYLQYIPLPRQWQTLARAVAGQLHERANSMHRSRETSAASLWQVRAWQAADAFALSEGSGSQCHFV